MTVKWQYSAPNNWSVESYSVCWKKAGTISSTCGSGGLGVSPKTITTSATTGSYSVTDLPDDGDKYKFKVKANIVKNSNSNKKRTKQVGTVKEFTDKTTSSPTSNCPNFGAVGQLYAEPNGETTMALTWGFDPDCPEWESDINTMTLCWERKGNAKGICKSEEDTILNPVFAAGYNVAGLKACKKYRFKLWGNYAIAKKEIGTIVMRTQCPPKMMMTDNSDCAEEGVSLCLPALSADNTTFGNLQEELADTIFDSVAGVLDAPSAHSEGISNRLIEGEVITAVERSVVYKNLQVGRLASKRDKKKLRQLHGTTCKKAGEQAPLTKEDIAEVARVSYFLRDAVDFVTDDLAMAIEDELYADFSYAVDRKIECGIDPCGKATTNQTAVQECLRLVPEITKEEMSGDIADAIEDIYDRFEISDCQTECGNEPTLEDILLVQMMEGEVTEDGCLKSGVITNRASSLIREGTLSNLFDEETHFH